MFARHMICMVIFDPRDCWLNRVNSHSDWSNPLKALKFVPMILKLLCIPPILLVMSHYFCCEDPNVWCWKSNFLLLKTQEKHCFCRSCLCGVSLLTTCEEQKVCGSKCGFRPCLDQWQVEHRLKEARQRVTLLQAESPDGKSRLGRGRAGDGDRLTLVNIGWSWLRLVDIC